MRYTLYVTDYPVAGGIKPKRWVYEYLPITKDRYPKLNLLYIEEFTADRRYVGLMVARPQDKEALEDLVQWPVIPVATGDRRKIEKAWARFLMDNTHLVHIS